jgi:hypothetical protein
MIRSHLSALVAGVTFLAVGLGVAGSASGALLGQPANTPFQAIYGSPATNGLAIPVGGGLGRSFGFGENMLFEASTEKKIGKNIEINHMEKSGYGEDDYIGGTLQSNKTGENNPLGFSIQFADFQDTTFGGKGPHYSDTSDRPWITTICAPGAEKCRVDPRFEVGVTKIDVKIEDVSIDLNGVVLQGTIWGQWVNGAERKPPCIKLEKPPLAAGPDQTLIDTQGGIVGQPITSIAGEFCLISANNDWYHISSSIYYEPPITIGNF